LRIVIFERVLSAFGGTERILFELAPLLRGKGHEVHIIYLYADRRKVSGKYSSDVSSILDHQGSVEEFPSSIYKSVVATIVSLPKMLKALVALRPNLIICPRSNVYVYIVTRIYRVPFLLIVNDTPFYSNLNVSKYAHFYGGAYWSITKSLPGHMQFNEPRPHLPLKQRIIAELIAIAKYLEARAAFVSIAPSRRVAWEARSLWGINPIVIPWGVRPYRSEQAQVRQVKERLILTVNRLEIIKRVDLLIRAFAEVCRMLEDVRLVIAGTGPEESSLRQLAKALGVDGRTQFLGFVPEESLGDLILSCEVFAFPSWDSYGLSVLEALSSGKKCLVTIDAAMVEVARGDSNLFISQSDPDSFARGLLQALQAKTAPVSDRIAKLTVESHCSKLTKILEALRE